MQTGKFIKRKIEVVIMNEVEYISFLNSYPLGAGVVKMIKDIEDIKGSNIPV